MEKCRGAVFEENTTVSQTSEEDRMTYEDKIFQRKMTVRMSGTNKYMKTLYKRSVAVIQMMKLSIDGIMNVIIILVFIIMMINESWNHFHSDKTRVSIYLIKIPS